MQFYVKTLSKTTVALMIGIDQVIAYFPSIYEALAAVEEWYQFNKLQPKTEVIFSDRASTMHNKMQDMQVIGY